MTTQEYAQEIRESLDRNRYATLIESLGTQLNDRKDRFDKSDIIEQSIEIYSNGRLKWIDGIGRDHTDQLRGYDLEFKYTANGIYTGTKKPKALVKIKVKNSLGENKGTYIEDPADYYVVGQQDAMSIISWEDIQPYLVSVSDGIEAHIPFDQLTPIFSPNEINISQSVEVNYKQIKAEAQKRLIESIQ